MRPAWPHEADPAGEPCLLGWQETEQCRLGPGGQAEGQAQGEGRYECQPVHEADQGMRERQHALARSREHGFRRRWCLDIGHSPRVLIGRQAESEQRERAGRGARQHLRSASEQAVGHDRGQREAGIAAHAGVRGPLQEHQVQVRQVPAQARSKQALPGGRGWDRGSGWSMSGHGESPYMVHLDHIWL